MATPYTIDRKIEIDAGHRVMTHGSKCRNLHGHRYTIHAICQAEELIQNGEQEQMVIDFGFLKDEMMKAIHDPCDHGLIMYRHDPILEYLLRGEFRAMTPQGWILGQEFQVPLELSHVGKMLLVDFIPTAEKLAEHWFWRLVEPIFQRSEKAAHLKAITVYETPNCHATYCVGR